MTERRKHTIVSIVAVTLAVGLVAILDTPASATAAGTAARGNPIAHVADCRFGYHGGPDGRCVPDKSQEFIDAMNENIQRTKLVKRGYQVATVVGGGAAAIFCPVCGVIAAAGGLVADWVLDDLIDDLTKTRDDPLDSHYAVLVKPAWTKLRALPRGLSASGTRAVLLLINRERELAANVQAMTSSYEKAQGADAFERYPKPWFSRQVGNAVTYARRAATLLDDMPRVRAAAARAIADLRGARKRVSRAQASAALARVRRFGFSRSVNSALRSMGLSAGTITRLERNAIRLGLSGLRFPAPSLADTWRAASMDVSDRRLARDLRARAKQLEPATRVQPTIMFTRCPAATVTPGSRVDIAGRMQPAANGTLLTLTWTVDWGSGSPPIVHHVRTDAAGTFSDSVTAPNPIRTYPNGGVFASFAGDATRKPAGSANQCSFTVEKTY